MKRTLLILIAALLAGDLASAQNLVVRQKKAPVPAPPVMTEQPSWSRMVPTEAMWMYEQHRRDYMDPEIAMRRRAEHKMWQRRHRLAAQRWYGYSNSRPTWHPTPSMSGTASHRWNGNSFDGYGWVAGAPWWGHYHPWETWRR